MQIEMTQALVRKNTFSSKKILKKKLWTRKWKITLYLIKYRDANLHLYITGLDKSFLLFYKMYFVKEASKDLMTQKDDHPNLDHGAFYLQHDG